uniref:Uncharacterized protein n=1 Tax=Wuchereria bancrofti TaxID=6293 RepID=A0AAF5PTE4_WUCBA
MSRISKLSAFFNNCVSYLPSLGEALTTTFSNGCSSMYSAEITLKKEFYKIFFHFYKLFSFYKFYRFSDCQKKKQIIFTELPPIMISWSFGKTMAIWIGEHFTLQNSGCSELFLPGKRFASKSMVRVPEIK